MTVLGYNVEVAGGDLRGFIGNEDQLRQLMAGMMRATVNTFYSHVQRALQNTTFKNTTGRLNRALRYQIDPMSGAIWMDRTVAPHAVYVERGVKRHTMTYLLKADRAIPIRLPGGRVIYRKATQKWMGRPHPITTIDEKTALPLLMMTSGWIHPGYDGKWFFLRGVRGAIEEVQKRNKRFVLRVSQLGFNALGEPI